MTPGQVATVSVSSIRGALSIQNSNPSSVSAQLISTKITVKALMAGSSSIAVRDASGTKLLAVTVAPLMTISPSTLNLTVGQSGRVTVTNPNGTLRVSSSNSTVATASLTNGFISILGKSAGSATVSIRDSKTTKTVAVTVTASGGGGVTSTDGRLLASNCFQCHGTNGSGGFEQLIGESEQEIYNELVGFSSGQEDANGIMAAHTKGYTDEQFRAIAKFLSGVANP